MSSSAINEVRQWVQPVQNFPGYGLRLRALHPTVAGEKLWTWIAVAFAAYWICFAVAYFKDARTLNFVGAAILLGVLLWASVERSWVKLNIVFRASCAAALLPFLQGAISEQPGPPDALIKYVSLCLVMAMASLLRLPVATACRTRWILAGQIAIVLLLSLFAPAPAGEALGDRSAGMFVNPNNLALVAFLLLLLVDERDRISLRLIIHFAVLTVLVITRTSGAIAAYFIGIGSKIAIPVFRRQPLLFGVSAVLIVTLTTLFVFGGAERWLPENRLLTQIAVVRVDFGYQLKDEQIP
jgi:hypothetical protein